MLYYYNRVCLCLIHIDNLSVKRIKKEKKQNIAFTLDKFLVDMVTWLTIHAWKEQKHRHIKNNSRTKIHFEILNSGIMDWWLEFNEWHFLTAVELLTVKLFVADEDNAYNHYK